jgi:hypothetical protein
MYRDHDVVLQLTDGTLPAHSQLLKVWSVPLGIAVDTLPAAGERVVPLQATVKDWGAVASMMYPAAEPVVIGWDNVEAVAVLADKYDITCLLQRAASFLENNVSAMRAAQESRNRRSSSHGFTCTSCNFGQLDSKGCCTYCRKSDPSPGSKDIWKWLQLSDRFGMARLTVACIQLVVSNYRNTATPHKLAGLSSGVKDLLLAELLSPGQAATWKEQLPAGINKEQLRILAVGAGA